MYGDFSRFLDGRYGQYSGVLAQQGRLLLDAELNEQNAIVLDYLRCLTTDLIGPFAGPADHAGFAVEPVVQDDECHAVRLGSGCYYVYGLRCESPAPHHPADGELPIAVREAPFVVYLEVWEQAVSAIQAPGLTDPALSADVPDTTRRRQVRWRPMAACKLPHGEDLTGLDRESIIAAFRDYDSDPPHGPTLAARAHSGDEPEPGPDTAPTPWGYRGVENQLYRVEVHDGGDGDGVTFKWSRDNGSVEVGLKSLGDPDKDGVREAVIRRAWYNAQPALEVGDWVEFIDDNWSPFGTPPPLMQVKKAPLADGHMCLQETGEPQEFVRKRHPLLRRWDQQPSGDHPGRGIPVQHARGKWLELEDGVHIRFDEHPVRYQRGDYWLIPARTATRDLLWPHSPDDRKVPLAIPPNGPLRYLAPLALVQDLAREPVNLRTVFGHLDEFIPGAAPRRRRPTRKEV